MEYKYEFKTEEELKLLKDQHNDKVIISIMYLKIGNYVIFSDNHFFITLKEMENKISILSDKLESQSNEISNLTEELNNTKQENANLYYEIMMLS